MSIGKIKIPLQTTLVKIKHIEAFDENGKPFSPAIFKYQVYKPGNPDEILETFNSEEDALNYIHKMGYKLIL